MDVTTSPPVGWNLDRRREYLEWGEKVVRHLPRVNEALEKLFFDVLEAGRNTLEKT